MPEPPDTAAPAVTVIVPTYNRADLIAETLESVAAQTFTDWECIVVDDGSTDNTREVVERFVARDSRFRYVRQENSSASHARNHGIRLARGEFIATLDSDDLFMPDRLEWQVQAMHDDPELILVYGHTLNFRPGRESEARLYMADLPDRPTGWAFEQLISCSSIYSPLVRAAPIRELGGFDTGLPSAEDWDMWLTLSRKGKILFQPRIALRYRIHPGNKSGNTLRNYRCACDVVAKHTRDLPAAKRRKLRADARAYFRRVYTQKLVKAAHDAGLAGDWPKARSTWRAVLTLRPAAALAKGAWPNVLWALLPTETAPLWRTRRLRRARQT